jgi:cell division transport system permease protein
MILYYLTETFTSLFRAKLGSLLVIFTTAIAISFVALSAGLVIFSNVINEKLKQNIQINLFVNDTLPPAEYSQIESELRGNKNIANYRLIDKDEALRLMKAKTGEDFLSVLESNPLPASYSVKLIADSVTTESIQGIISSLKRIQGIDDVVYDYTMTLKILNYVNSSKKIIYGVSIFLVLLSIYLVYSNNKLLLSSRITQYNTMKLVGAKLRTIKLPIFLTGVIMGLIASIICIAVYYLAFQLIKKFYLMDFINFNLFYAGVVICLLGIVLGFLGSFFATLNVSLKINKIK